MCGFALRSLPGAGVRPVGCREVRPKYREGVSVPAADDGIDKTGHQLLALHQHNEQEGATSVVERLRLGQRVAYVSDAGTPGSSVF